MKRTTRDWLRKAERDNRLAKKLGWGSENQFVFGQVRPLRFVPSLGLFEGRQVA